jgi:hypothetical protein
MESEVITLPSTRYLAISLDQTFVLTTRTVTELIEMCLSEGISCVLAQEQHVPSEFFQLQTLEAGEILQKLRTYGIRLAIVVLKERHYSRRFQEMVAEQSGRGYFGIFTDKQRAENWFRDTAQ